MEAHRALKEKCEHFRQLGSLVAFDDGKDRDEVETRQDLGRQQSRRFFLEPPRASRALPVSGEDIERAAKVMLPKRVSSAPNPGRQASTAIVKATQPDVVPQKGHLAALMNTTSSTIDETIIPDTERPSVKFLRRSDSTPLTASTRLLVKAAHDSPSIGISLKKRKRDSAPKLRPPEEQIFRGLAFFYIPNDDVAPARRLRINKAREYGATWTRDALTATHVIADKHLKYKDVERVIASRDSTRGLEIVTEEYPIDCIQFRTLLDAGQRKYQVVGQPLQTGEEAPPNEGLRPVPQANSLPLKPPQRNSRKWDFVPPMSTPPRADEASHRNGAVELLTLADSQPVSLDIGQIAESPELISSDEDEKIASDLKTTQVKQRQTTARSNRGRSRARDQSRDELSEFISMIQEFKDLPLDADEDDAYSVVDLMKSPSDVQRGSGSEDDQIRKSKRDRGSRNTRNKVAFEDRFACNHAGTKSDSANNPNSRTIEVLQKMASYYERVDDHWRTTAYRKAITTLKRQEVKITTEEEALRLPHIGGRLAQKIEEIVTTNRLKRLEYAEEEPLNESLQLFLQIYGVGNKQASQWIAQGFRTLEDLKAGAKLTFSQTIGIDHHHDLNTRIPRLEVEALGSIVKTAAARVDPAVELIVGGSYRRGAESSHDIDIIVTKPGTQSSVDLRRFLDDLVDLLEAEKFLVARLASSRAGSDGSKWHGCCVLPKAPGLNEDGGHRPTWRRIDFLLVPEPEMGAALIYFTGNDIFNRSMRLLASKKGMRLNQRGLYRDVLRRPDRSKVSAGELVEGRDERRIFEILGVKWREPEERWC